MFPLPEESVYNQLLKQVVHNNPPESWFLRTPYNGGCLIVLFPKKFPQGLNILEFSKYLAKNGFTDNNNFEFFCKDAWKKEMWWNQQSVS